MAIVMSNGFVSQSFMEEINQKFVGEFYLMESGTDSHFMTASTVIVYLKELIGPVPISGVWSGLLPGFLLKHGLLPGLSVRPFGFHCLELQTILPKHKLLVLQAFVQRRHALKLPESYGMLLADSFMGHHAFKQGEDLLRKEWGAGHKILLPHKNPGGWSAKGQPCDAWHYQLRRPDKTLMQCCVFVYVFVWLAPGSSTIRKLDSGSRQLGTLPSWATAFHCFQGIM